MSKPNISIPTEFATNGTKTDFSADKISNGFDRLQPDVLSGDNLNKFIDDTYKGLNGVLDLYKGAVLYDVLETYTDKSIVFDININNEVKLYRSLINNNTGNNLTDISKWQDITPFWGNIKGDITQQTDLMKLLNKSLEYSFNSGNVTSGNADLIDATLSQDTEKTEPDTYTFEVQTAGYYPIELVGGGGGAWAALNSLGYMSYCGGGSGAAFVGEVYLNVGTHQIVVGAIDNTYNVGNSILYDENGNALITAGGGTKGAGTNYNLSKGGGYGGTLTIADGVQTQNVTVQTNGLDGGFNNGNQAVAGGASVYGGYGTGANSPADNNSTDGYFSIVLPSASSNVSYKVGGSYPALTGTLADGKQFTLNGLNSDDITGLGDGSYIKYVGSDGSSELLKANLTVAKTVPLSPSANDVWVNNSVSPLSVKKYIEPNYTVFGTLTISEEGVASGFSNGNGISLVGKVPFTQISVTDVFQIEINTYIPTTLSGYKYLLLIGNSGLYLDDAVFRINYNNYATFMSVTGINNFAGKNVKVVWIIDGQNNTTTCSITDINNPDNSVSNTSAITPATINANNTFKIGENAQYSWAAPVDLKELKIYVDGTLVYQPVFPNGWIDYNKVPVGKITLLSGGITGVKTFPYNIDYVGNNIIETYQNGADWYRVYADGFCVQGSAEAITSSTSQTAKIRDLLKPFKDTDYTVLVTPNTSYSSDFSPRYFSVKEKTTGSFTTTFDLSCSWVAYGYVNLIN